MTSLARQNPDDRRNFFRAVWFCCAVVVTVLLILLTPGSMVDRMRRNDLLHDTETCSARLIAQL